MEKWEMDYRLSRPENERISEFVKREIYLTKIKAVMAKEIIDAAAECDCGIESLCDGIAEWIEKIKVTEKSDENGRN